MSTLGDTLVGTLVVHLRHDGEPVTKGRARAGQGRHFTPAKTRAAEEEVGWELRAAGCRTPDADHYLAVELRFRCSTGQRKDLDNMVKLVLDACNEVAWKDDFQVVRLQAEVERPSDEPGFDLTITRLGRYTVDCRGCGRVIEHRAGRAKTKEGFCSRDCYDEAQRLGGMHPCSNCGTEVYRQRAKVNANVFCTRRCQGEFLAGKPRATQWAPAAL